jgi:hypothetical protein
VETIAELTFPIPHSTTISSWKECLLLKKVLPPTCCPEFGSNLKKCISLGMAQRIPIFIKDTNIID